MSVSYVFIGWNRQKKVYDLTLLGLLLAMGGVFAAGFFIFNPEVTAETLILRSTAFSAFVFLHLVLSIGPLTRLDSRFLPLLYNRRHFGVLIALLGLIHASISVFQFHALGNIPARLSVLTSYLQDFAFWQPEGALAQVPFEPFGLLALIILALMAATSHDFWLKQLGATVWKRLHVLVYVAYFAIVVHVAFGYLQSERNLNLVSLLGAGLFWLLGLHVAAHLAETKRYKSAESLRADGYYSACKRSDLIEGRAHIVEITGKRIAVYLHKGVPYAVSNTCRHQGGPVGEGRIIDGCITCPWHGWQYKPEDGCSPPPFKEVIPTYAVDLVGEQIFVRPNEVIKS